MIDIGTHFHHKLNALEFVLLHQINCQLHGLEIFGWLDKLYISKYMNKIDKSMHTYKEIDRRKGSSEALVRNPPRSVFFSFFDSVKWCTLYSDLICFRMPFRFGDDYDVWSASSQTIPPTSENITGWWARAKPLWKIWVRQLGFFDIPNINGKIKLMLTKPPTRLCLEISSWSLW